MHSELFSLGPFTIRAYGLCMALGFLLAWQAATWLCRRTQQDPEPLAAILMWTVIAALIGARTAYVLEHWQAEFANAPAQIIRIDQGGLMFYGGFIGAALALIAYSLIHKRHLFTTTDLLTAVLPAGHALGRIGCFFHGCCYGKLTNSSIGICFPRGSPAWWDQLYATPPLITQQTAQALPVIPTQLIEAGANALIFVLLFTLYPRRYQQRGFITGCYLIAYAILRFSIENLRGDPRLLIGPLSIGQTISLATLTLGTIFITTALRTRKHL